MPVTHKRPVARQAINPVAVPEDGSTNKGKYLTYIIIFLAGLVIGYMYNRMSTLEKKVAGGTVANQQAGAGAAAPTNVPKADLKVNKDDPTMGPENAKVTVITFEDFQCPFCGAFSGLDDKTVKSMQQRDSTWQPALSNIIKDYVNSGKVRLVWKDYPFLGDESRFAASAARCAQEQNKFWEYHDYLFSHQNGENQGGFSKDNLKKFAVELKLNTADFNKCLDSDKYLAKMDESMTYGQGVGVSGTPATFVNGQFISGAVSYSQFKTAIDAALSQ